MRIVQLCTELAPVAKVGGLADVIYGLSKELARLGHEVEVFLPKYDTLDYARLKDLKVHTRELWCQEGANRFNNTIWSASVDGLKVLLLEPHHPEFYFGRGSIYGSRDDNDRFIYFCKAVFEFFLKRGERIDCLHLHDWPTALAPLLYKEMYKEQGLKIGGTVLTIHSLEHQGRASPHNLTKIGLRGESFLTPEKLQDPVYPEALNLLKGGIEYSDLITTVSPTYEKEIQTPEGGHGLDPILRKYEKKLKGILNGIDEDFWNPEKDPHLVQRYTTHGLETMEQVESVVKAKAENAAQLRAHFRMSTKAAPLVVCVTRLVPQKAPELIKHALLHTLEKGGQFVLLGSSHIPAITRVFEDLKKELSHNSNVAICLDTNEALAHLIYASADISIIPSLFEPCGLTQLISLRYGTVPIARMTGGLADTVFDADTSERPEVERNGFVFEFPDSKGINWALDRALDCWANQPKKWHRIILNGIHRDFSWRHSAQEYVKVFESLTAKSSSKEAKQKSKNLSLA